jgi:hypothetical protein
MISGKVLYNKEILYYQMNLPYKENPAKWQL